MKSIFHKAFLTNSITFLYLLLMYSLIFVNAAIWVDHPDKCPVEYNDISCADPELQCGINPSDQPYCYETTTLSPPASLGSVSSGNENSSINGGWIVGCQETDGTSPYCDNGGSFWCEHSTTCYNVGRQTNCLANVWANDSTPTSCSSTCRTDGYDHFACDGSTTDGDGCEIRVGDSCGSGTGTVDSSETSEHNNKTYSRINISQRVAHHGQPTTCITDIPH